MTTPMKKSSEILFFQLRKGSLGILKIFSGIVNIIDFKIRIVYNI